MHGLWSVEELADWLTGCDEVARGRCLVVGNFNMKTSTAPTKGQRRADQT